MLLLSEQYPLLIWLVFTTHTHASFRTACKRKQRRGDRIPRGPTLKAIRQRDRTRERHKRSRGGKPCPRSATRSLLPAPVPLPRALHARGSQGLAATAPAA